MENQQVDQLLQCKEKLDKIREYQRQYREKRKECKKQGVVMTKKAPKSHSQEYKNEYQSSHLWPI